MDSSNPSPAQRLQSQRHDAGLTQAELADRAGVSRALISALEAGRHLPRVDAALALATALGTTAEALFGDPPETLVDALSGEAPKAGTAVRLGCVGGRTVSAAPRLGGDGWEIVDGVVGAMDDGLRRRGGQSVVLAGCEPGLVVMERLLREQGTGALAIGASSAEARRALAAGRLHGAVLHDVVGKKTRDAVPGLEGTDIVRVHLARWRVGLAAPAGSPRGWWRDALGGRLAVVQRAAGATAQRAFQRALADEVDGVDGPIAGGHLEACRLALARGSAAVTIEPAAASVGAAFHPLEIHDVELCLDAARMEEPAVRRLLDLLHEAPLRVTLESVGGYDLSHLGSRAA